MFGIGTTKTLQFITALCSLSQTVLCSQTTPQHEDSSKEKNNIPTGTADVNKEPICLGIDLGTTFCSVFMYKQTSGTYEMLTYENTQEKIFPSTIYFTGDNTGGYPKYLVGYAANAANTEKPNGERYIYRWKPMIGQTSISDNNPLAKFAKYDTYKMKRGVDSENKGYYFAEITTDDNKVRSFTPTEFSTLLLDELRSRVEALNYNIRSLCITTPVYFTPSQDAEVIKAAEAAKLPRPHITKEPVAACISYSDGHMDQNTQEKTILVFDVGGGTTDASILEVYIDKADEADVKNKKGLDTFLTATKFVGNNFLGGENVNDAIFDIFCSKILKENKVTKLRDNDKLRLRIFIEKFKIALCNKQSAIDEKINYDPKAKRDVASHTDFFLYSRDTKDQTENEKYWEIELSLDTVEFEKLPVFNDIKSLFFNQVDGLFREDLENGNSELADSIEKVVLVGGSTRIPKIHWMVREVCKKAKVMFRDDEVDLAVGRGAAMTAVSVDPEVGDSSLMVQSVVPMTIGTELYDRSYLKIIEKDVTIPTEAFVMCTTASDNQTLVNLPIYVGLRPLAKDNELIGQLQLKLQKPQPKGVPQIKVSILYNSDYSFKVTAEDVATGVSESVSFDSKLGKPSESKIKEIMEAARKHKAADDEMMDKLEKLRLLVAKLEFFENMIKQATNLNEIDKSYFEAILEGNKKWIEDNKEVATSMAFESKLDDLTKSVEELTNKIKESVPTEQQKTPSSDQPERESGRDIL